LKSKNIFHEVRLNTMTAENRTVRNLQKSGKKRGLGK